MTFPAWETFEADARIRLQHVRLFRFARRTLDFREIRLLKQGTAAERTGLDRSDLRRALNDLVAWGYLVEHERADRQARQFTLAWSVRADRRWGNTPPTHPHGASRGAA
jgi:hypothetical protein